MLVPIRKIVKYFCTCVSTPVRADSLERIPDFSAHSQNLMPVDTDIFLHAEVLSILTFPLINIIFAEYTIHLINNLICCRWNCSAMN